MAETPDPVNKAIWEAAASHLFADAVPDTLRLLSLWASDVLKRRVQLEPVGSAVTGITDTSSDIDVVLFSPDCELPDAGDVLARLYDARDTLSAFQVIRFVPTARAPVLTLARADGITLDLTANNHLPIYNSALLKEYCELDGRLRPLACAVKRFAKAANVVGAASKNLSSYAWSLLVVFYLQAVDLNLYLPAAAESKKLVSLQSLSNSREVKLEGRVFDVGFKRLADMTPAESTEFSCKGIEDAFPWRALVLGFFKFYSEDVDLDRTVLSVRCGRALPIKDAGLGPHIEDPFDPEHQLGSVLSDTRREAFREALTWGKTMLEDDSAFAELLEGHADLRSPVVWDTLMHSDELVHHRVRPEGSTTEAKEAYSDCPISDAVLAALGHSLDEFQRRAIYCTAQGESVIVAAPTSAGKTAVAEAAMIQTLLEHRSAIFCSPTKALSNQKFVDFQQKFPNQVGLLTGDVSIAAASSIVVATTEVLQFG
eukprot:s1577_g5.t1